MTNLAIIHAGPAAESLKMLVRTLDSVGVRENFFMTDLIETLRYDESFKTDLQEMTCDMLYGDFFHHHLSRGNVEKYKALTSEFLEVTAIASNKVAQYLHETLVNQGRYDTDGKFPYEFHSFNGKVICLRQL
jgi:hypothetical protein